VDWIRLPGLWYDAGVRREHAWGTVAVVLGVWEVVAFSTRRAPTITATCRRARGHRVGRFVIAAWCIALWWHLDRPIS